MLLALTLCPAHSIMMSAANFWAVLTSIIAGLAWSPIAFDTIKLAHPKRGCDGRTSSLLGDAVFLFMNYCLAKDSAGGYR